MDPIQREQWARLTVRQRQLLLALVANYRRTGQPVYFAPNVAMDGEGISFPNGDRVPCTDLDLTRLQGGGLIDWKPPRLQPRAEGIALAEAVQEDKKRIEQQMHADQLASSPSDAMAGDRPTEQVERAKARGSWLDQKLARHSTWTSDTAFSPFGLQSQEKPTSDSSQPKRTELVVSAESHVSAAAVAKPDSDQKHGFARVKGDHSEAQKAPAEARLEQLTATQVAQRKRASTVGRLIKELDMLKPQLFEDEKEYETLRARYPTYLVFQIVQERHGLRMKVLAIQGSVRHIRLAQELAAAHHGRALSTIQEDWKNFKPAEFRRAR